MGMVLDKQKFEEGIAVLMSSASGDCVEALETIGSILKTEDQNDMIEQVLHNGALFQQAWNEEYRPSVDGVIADFSATYDIAGMVEKANVGEVTKIDASFSAGKIDSASLVL